MISVRPRRSASAGAHAYCEKHSSNSLLPTKLSTADSGSSANRREGDVYNPRAMQSLCICPPDRVVPRSPSSVSSPFAKRLTSFCMHASSTTRCSLASSNGLPMVMLCLTVPAAMNGACVMYPMSISTSGFSPPDWARPLTIADRNELFPLPTRPTTATEVPRLMSTVMSASVCVGASSSSSCVGSWASAACFLCSLSAFRDFGSARPPTTQR
eukprot:gene353-biopygen367